MREREQKERKLTSQNKIKTRINKTKVERKKDRKRDRKFKGEMPKKERSNIVREEDREQKIEQAELKTQF